MAIHAGPTRSAARGRTTPERGTAPRPAPRAPRPPWLPSRPVAPAIQAAGRNDRDSEAPGGCGTATTMPSAGPPRPNRTGLPDGLKTGVEALSGLAMDDVRVHRNSSEPAKLGALAFTQGSDIHLGPGQERHLPHEAWHIVQQKQERVTATAQMKGVGLNESAALEAEADLLGARAAQWNVEAAGQTGTRLVLPNEAGHGVTATTVVQRRKAEPPQVDLATAPNELGDTQGLNVDCPLWHYSYIDKGENASRSEMLGRVAAIYGAIGAQAAKFNYLTQAGVIDQCKTYVAQSKDQTKARAFANDMKKYEIGEQDWPLIETAAAGDVDLADFRDKKYIRSATDPFAVDISSFYKLKPDAKDDYMSLTVQFAEGFPGYIIKVEDTALDVLHFMEGRERYTGQEKGAKETVGTFSSKHHVASKPVEAYISQITPKSSKFEAEQGVDAITKVIAEGGRFEPVRLMGTSISDDTIFYVRQESGQSVESNSASEVKVSNLVFRGISFRDLWLSWGVSFEGKYGIPVSVVRDKVKSGKIKRSHLAGGGDAVQTLQKLPDGALHFDLEKK